MYSYEKQVNIKLKKFLKKKHHSWNDGFSYLKHGTLSFSENILHMNWISRDNIFRMSCTVITKVQLYLTVKCNFFNFIKL